MDVCTQMVALGRGLLQQRVRYAAAVDGWWVQLQLAAATWAMPVSTIPAEHDWLAAACSATPTVIWDVGYNGHNSTCRAALHQRSKGKLPGTLELKICLNRRFTRRQGAVGVWRGWRRSAVHDAAQITCSMAAAQQQAVVQQPAPSLLGSRACSGMCLAVNSDLQTLQEPGS